MHACSPHVDDVFHSSGRTRRAHESCVWRWCRQHHSGRMAVRLLVCYIELPHGPPFETTLLARSLTVAMLEPTNLCGGNMSSEPSVRAAMSGPTGHLAANRFRLAKVGAYAATADPDVLLIVLDTDVVLNGVASAEQLVHRFEEARGTSRIVYQAEPFCWAPYNGRHGGIYRWYVYMGGCATNVLRMYDTMHNQSSGQATATSRRNLSWRCPRFLNSGLYAGRAVDLAIYAGAATAAQGSKSTSGDGAVPLGASAFEGGFERGCYRDDDQCVATYRMLRSQGWV